MRIVVALLFHKAVKPSTYIINLEKDTWRHFLWGGRLLRIDIVCRTLAKENLSSYIREIAWFPLEGQNLIQEVKQ